MNKNEEKLFMFAYELAKKLSEISHSILYDEPIFLFGKYEVNLYDICDLNESDARKCISENEMSVGESRENEDLAAYLICEGTLYEALYFYTAYGEKLLGDDTSEVDYIFDSLSWKYGIWSERDSGALAYYWREDAL